ncbi:ketopantoate reductase family protein [Brevibacillus dissolubilis]|uniref:ketopantoate reductase family protein n=1 Tax=Brevibacillus dissolubilis TaxID=1844116 RepID=UPI0011162E5A|nr:2-dehydropantoate 2-reductase [Brevibacillus dissolubilis]
MQIVVIGGGSVGLLLSARLRLVGADVTLVTRSQEQASAIQQQGITYHPMNSNIVQIPLHAQPSTEELPFADLYVIALKQTHIPHILPLLSKIPPSSKVIALQNGMGHQDLLKEVLRQDQVYFGINTEGARRLSPIEVVHTGAGMLRVGPWEKITQSESLIHSFVQISNQAKIPAEYAEETASLLWKKLLANACINPLTTIFEIPNGGLLENSLTLCTMRKVFDEAKQVACASGVEISEKDWKDILTICRSTSLNHSSMLQDLWNQRPTEIDAINGYIVTLATKYNIPVPMHETILRIVLLKTSL